MKIGIIGGSGLDNPDLIKDYKEINLETPYGEPSSNIISGKVGDIEVFILARHGREHQIPPTQVNNKANIFALGKLGCKKIIATTAVGSLKEEIKRGDFIILNDFIDFTRHREVTFFKDFKSNPEHAEMINPFTPKLREEAMKACRELGIRYHGKGVVITIEGPRFSTVAESKMFKRWGADVINMSIAPEVILAREAGLEYLGIGMSTDYDVWKEDKVSWDKILGVFNKNAEKMKKLLIRIIRNLSDSKKTKEDLKLIKSKIRTIPDFPKPGIQFRDITTLLKDKEGMKKTLNILYSRYKDRRIEVVAGIESRGFLFASLLADKLDAKLVPIRKEGKLPGEVMKEEYELEYGKDTIEVHKDAISREERVLVVDDLIATGGTSKAACNLIEKLGGVVVENVFIVELPDLEGRKNLKWPVFSLVKFKGE
jgi:5'-methylthioadenosine phosphorylase